MTQGLYVRDDAGQRRPEDKTEVVRHLLAGGAGLHFERYTMHDPYVGPAHEAPVGTEIEFVGPDPRIARIWFGTATRTAGGWAVA